MGDTLELLGQAANLVSRRGPQVVLVYGVMLLTFAGGFA